MTKNLNVRLDDQIIREVEECRDPVRFPTTSDFVRAALRRMCRAVRRERMPADVERLVESQDELARAAELAEANFPDVAERWARADRGGR